jgi:chemotaxis signal transduction protein
MKNDKARARTIDGSGVPLGGRAPSVGAPGSGPGEKVRSTRSTGSRREVRSEPASRPVPEDLTIAGLECRVGKAPIVVPVEHVAQIIEYETSPLPLTRRWISGVGLHDDRLVMTIRLMPEATGAPPSASTPAESQPGRHRTKAVLLSVPDSKVAWALEVQEVVVLVRASVIERRRVEPRTGDLPPWIGRARTVDGRSIAWIDVPAMLADLSSPPRALA